MNFQNKFHTLHRNNYWNKYPIIRTAVHVCTFLAAGCSKCLTLCMLEIWEIWLLWVKVSNIATNFVVKRCKYKYSIPFCCCAFNLLFFPMQFTWPMNTVSLHHWRMRMIYGTYIGRPVSSLSTADDSLTPSLFISIVRNMVTFCSISSAEYLKVKVKL